MAAALAALAAFIEHAEDAHTNWCDAAPPHSIADCEIFGYDDEGIYVL